MEVVMNVAGASAAQKKAPAQNAASDRILRDNAILRQKLMRITEVKEKLLGDKAEAEAAATSAKNELLMAYNTIASLKAQVSELTASLEAATAPVAAGSKKNKKQKAEQDGGDVSEG